MKVKEESEKAGLKLSIQKTKIVALSTITSWQIDGETVETVTNFIFLGSRITADGDCSHEIKTHLLFGRRGMPNLDSILKSRDITLPTKVHLVKAMVYPVVMYGYESWTVKKVECWRCFWTVVLEKTLESPLDCKEIRLVNPKGNQPWVFIGRTDAEAEVPILWLPHCEELNHWKRPWCWERLRARGEGDDRGWDGWMASPTQWSLSKLWEIVKNRKVVSMLQSTGLQSQTWLSDWTIIISDIEHLLRWLLAICMSPLEKWSSLVPQRLKRLPACRRPRFDPWVGKIPWRRKWQPTPVFLPGESHGGRSLVGYSPWGRKESDTTERLHSLGEMCS